MSNIKPSTKPPIPNHILQKIVAETEAHPQTVRRAYHGLPGRGPQRRRVEAALRAAGLLCALLLALGCSTDGSGLATEGTGGATALSRPSSTLPGTGGATGQATSRQLVGSGGSVQVTTVPPRGTGGSVQDAIGDTGAIVVRDAGGEVAGDTTPATCLPFEQTGCPSGQACYYGPRPITQPVPLPNVYCAPVGTGAIWSACTTVSDCSAGTTCARRRNLKGTGWRDGTFCLQFCIYDGTANACPGTTDNYSCDMLSGSGTFEANIGICDQ